MKFIFDTVVATQDTNKFAVAGRLTPETEEDKVLVHEMIEGIKTLNNNLQENNCVIPQTNTIVYANIPISACANIIRTFERNFGIKIGSELSETAEIYPPNARAFAKMEIARLFG